jgi:hypothetical protein
MSNNVSPKDAGNLNFCRRCGSSLEGMTKFCGRCGATIMSTALPSTPTKRRLIRIYGTLAAVAIGVVLTVSYMLNDHTDQHQPLYVPTTVPWRPFSTPSTPAPPPFWQPGPPADLITMLRRGFHYSEWNDP